MAEKFKVLFVCTGNIFRSLSAEYLLRGYLKSLGVADVSVSSAGTMGTLQSPDPDVVRVLTLFGCDIGKHRQKKLTKELLDGADLVVAMAKSHQDFIRKTFGLSVPLFNEVVGFGSSSVDDVNEAVANYLANRGDVVRHIEKTIKHIHDFIPSFYNNFRSYAKNRN